MRTARSRQQRIPRRHVVLLPIQYVAALPADDVVDLVLVLGMQADPRAFVQHALAQHEREVRVLGEKRVRRGRPRSTMRAGLGHRDVTLVDHARGFGGLTTPPCTAHLAVDIALQRRGEFRLQRHPVTHHQARHRRRTGHAEVRAIGLVLLGYEHEIRPGTLLAQRADPARGAVIEVDQRDLLTAGQRFHRLGVHAMRIQQRAEVVQQPRHRGDQHRRGALVAGQLHVALQELRVGNGGIGVARGVFELGVVVAELDQQHVTALELGGDRIQALFVDEAARAAAALGVVADLPHGGIEIALQGLAPAGLWRALRAVLGGGGIPGNEDAVRGAQRAGGREQERQGQQQTQHGHAPGWRAAGQRPARPEPTIRSADRGRASA